MKKKKQAAKLKEKRIMKTINPNMAANLRAGLPLRTSVKAGCTTYLMPDGGGWEACVGQCDTDNDCRLFNHEFFDEDYVDHLYGCIKYWCHGRRGYRGTWYYDSITYDFSE